MAKAINRIPRKEPDPQARQKQSIEELLGKTADSRAALEDMLGIMQGLKEAGLLDLLKGLINQRHEAGSIALRSLNTPATHRLLKNGTELVNLLSGMDTDELHGLVQGISNGIRQSAESARSKEQIGIWDLIKLLKDPDINTAAAAIAGFLKGLGAQLNAEPDGKKPQSSPDSPD